MIMSDVSTPRHIGTFLHRVLMSHPTLEDGWLCELKLTMSSFQGLSRTLVPA